MLQYIVFASFISLLLFKIVHNSLVKNTYGKIDRKPYRSILMSMNTDTYYKNRCRVNFQTVSAECTYSSDSPSK